MLEFDVFHAQFERVIKDTVPIMKNQLVEAQRKYLPVALSYTGLDYRSKSGCCSCKIFTLVCK